MWFIFKVFFALIIGQIFYIYVKITSVPEAPVYPDTWWGQGDPDKEDTAIKPFEINVAKKFSSVPNVLRLEVLIFKLDNHPSPIYKMKIKVPQVFQNYELLKSWLRHKASKPYASNVTLLRPYFLNYYWKVLNDLKHRLNNALPFQPPLEGVKQHYGMNTHFLKKVVEYWKNNYNWTERQQFLNKYPQYTTSIQGLKIHYIHVKPKVDTSSNVKILPLLLLHGWPGSIREFYELIPFLTEPQPGRKVVFEVIAPSLPGYGFSDATNKPGMSPARMGQIFKNLMGRLSFDKFFVQGGDWGAVILSTMSVLYPENLLGAHSNWCFCISTFCHIKTWLIGTTFPSLLGTAEELPLFSPMAQKMGTDLLLETGYFHIQATKPDTVGVALRDSPVGLAAYILEKFTTWTNPQWKDLEDGGLTRKFTMDQLLDNVMIYWATRSITTSQRLYAETFNKAYFAEKIEEIPSKVPTACARFRNDILVQPESLLRSKWHNLTQVTLYQNGGHFAAFELPEVLANDVYSFIEKVI